jgi:hypothetical protein
MTYNHRENRELDFLDSCEILTSPFSMTADYDVSVALDFLTEALRTPAAAGEPNERFFRLILAVRIICRVRRLGVWPAVTYFALWSARLEVSRPMELDDYEKEIAKKCYA